MVHNPGVDWNPGWGGSSNLYTLNNKKLLPLFCTQIGANLSSNQLSNATNTCAHAGGSDYPTALDQKWWVTQSRRKLLTWSLAQVLKVVFEKITNSYSTPKNGALMINLVMNPFYNGLKYHLQQQKNHRIQRTIFSHSLPLTEKKTGASPGCLILLLQQIGGGRHLTWTCDLKRNRSVISL